MHRWLEMWINWWFDSLFHPKIISTDCFHFLDISRCCTWWNSCLSLCFLCFYFSLCGPSHPIVMLNISWASWNPSSMLSNAALCLVGFVVIVIELDKACCLVKNKVYVCFPEVGFNIIYVMWQNVDLLLIPVPSKEFSDGLCDTSVWECFSSQLMALCQALVII